MTNQSRLKFIKELESFLQDKQTVLSSVLGTLGWTQESMKDVVKVCCSVNPGHWIPESSQSCHNEICKLVKDGYTKEELEKQPPDSAFFYEKTSNVIPVVIDKSSLERILTDSNLKTGGISKDVPYTPDRWCVEFTPEQRLAVYDFTINASKAAEKSQKVKLEDLMIDFEKKGNEEDKPKSQLEILAEIRDYKRRRQSYRAKNVHITKKSYTEIMREVIENQTNYLMEIRKMEDSKEKRHEDSSNRKRRHSDNSDVNDSSRDISPRRKDHHSRHRRNDDNSDINDSSRDVSPRRKDHHSRHRRNDDDSKHHHSKHKSSKHSPKKKKHKRDRSSSSSRHKHKKSHKRESDLD